MLFSVLPTVNKFLALATAQIWDRLPLILVINCVTERAKPLPILIR